MYESPWDSVRLSVRQQWTHASCKLKPKLPHMCSALSSNAQPKQACFLHHRERPQVLFWARLTLLWILFHHALNRGSLLTGQPWVVYVLPQRQAANTLHVALIRMRRMLADKYQLLAAFNASANAPPINLASTWRGRPRSRAETPIWEGIITPRAAAGSSSLLLTALIKTDSSFHLVWEAVMAERRTAALQQCGVDEITTAAVLFRALAWAAFPGAIKNMWVISLESRTGFKNTGFSSVQSHNRAAMNVTRINNQNTFISFISNMRV